MAVLGVFHSIVMSLFLVFPLVTACHVFFLSTLCDSSRVVFVGQTSGGMPCLDESRLQAK